MKNKYNYKFGSITDLHTNYNQGVTLLNHALLMYQKENTPFIIHSGDIGESQNDYIKYENLLKTNVYKGIIFTCLGNHDQYDYCREFFIKDAIYDGINNVFVSLDKANEYFKNSDYKVIYEDIENNKKTYYYYVIYKNSLFFFMDQMLATCFDTSNQDNFSSKQLDYLESIINRYYGTHTIYIIEHAPINGLKVGLLKGNNNYSNCIELKNEFINNNRFKDILFKYENLIWISGHTHLSFADSNVYVNTYDNKRICNCIHNSSTSQPRVFYNNKVLYGTDYKVGSEGFMVYDYNNKVVFEERIFKNRQENEEFDNNKLIDKVNDKYIIEK